MTHRDTAAASGRLPLDSKATRPAERLIGLDVLRGLAALSVLAFHFTTRFGGIFGHPTAPSFVAPWGQRGVEVFFVLSGFAIERSLASSPSWRDFLESRALRLYPTFWAALLLTFTVVRFFGLPDREVSVRDALLNITMIPESLGVRAVDAVYWTLERELRFYGLVLLLLALGLRRFTVPMLLATVVLQTLGSYTGVVPHWLSDLLNLGWAHLFACGALLARLQQAPSWRDVAGIALCMLASRSLGFTAFAYGAGAVALVWIAGRPFVGSYPRPLAFFGRISYPLYLVHQYVGYVLMRALYANHAPTAVAIPFAVAVAVALATLLHFTVEERCLELIRRRRQRSADVRGPALTQPAGPHGAPV